MAVGEGVGVVGVGQDAQARRVVVDQEEGRASRLAIRGEGVEDHEVGVIGACHEPLLAVQDPLVPSRIADGGGADAPGVRSGLGLGDRIAP